MFEGDDYLKAAFVIFAIGVVGVAVNIYVLHAVFRHKVFSYAFGAGCVSHTIANLGITITFSFVVVPFTLIDPNLHHHYYLGRSGHVNVFCYFLSESSHLFLAVNRFAIMLFPVRYGQMFTQRNCNLMIGSAWLFSFLASSPSFWPECLAPFKTSNMAFNIPPSLCGYVAIVYLCHHFSIGLVILIASLDLMTFYKIRTMKKMAILGDENRRNREVRFFFQAVAQGVNFVVELILYFELSPYVKNQWGAFAMTTVAWISVHTIDGFIVVAFNRKMWKREVASVSAEAYAIASAPRHSSLRS
ncbi:hypothetical protein QR680_012290 [Steinernema hermaphroditum]|uniref:G-protein coupled receptors family 1 profile domain-containing protein n=1 Tax=Steinernema hermaphroditum TaxID=289476 RepID=A0AA39I3H6_9BILA|nr:hypothetical protein QR680_012290 [Steinernema hermaphroditum]